MCEEKKQHVVSYRFICRNEINDEIIFLKYSILRKYMLKDQLVKNNIYMFNISVIMSKKIS